MKPISRISKNMLLLPNSPLLKQKSINWNLSTEISELKIHLELLKSHIKNATGYHKNTVIAISSPQIGISKRTFIMCPQELWSCENINEKYRDFLIYINPRITQISQKNKLHWEACLSYPE